MFNFLLKKKKRPLKTGAARASPTSLELKGAGGAFC